jgi:tricorn protease
VVEKPAAKAAEPGKAGEAGKPPAEPAGAAPAAAPETGKPAATDTAAAAKPEPVRIDFEGLDARVEMLPIPFDNYFGLTAVDGGLVYARTGGAYYGRGTDRPTTLHFFSFDKREATELASGVSGYAVAPDRSKLLIHEGPHYFVASASAAGKEDKKELKLDGLDVERVPADEWPQIFQEVWRRYRDFFYVDNMHGYDWEALREQYLPLVAHVRDRSDLNYVIGEMIAELSVGHAYIVGGDIDRPKRPECALPGAVLELDADAGRYSIKEILPGENDDPVYRSPLTEVGVNVKAGDYVLAIDGRDLTADVNPYKLLRRVDESRVRLTVNSKPTAEGAREITFAPLRDEEKLRYLAFVERNRVRVEQLSGGKLGYVHLPDMGAEGIREFIKQFYPQRDKEGLVIDDRYNGGGNISQMVVNRLARKLLLCAFARTTGFSTYPAGMYYGHLVCLLNETSASDGDIFPAAFRGAHLGPLIGKRSWGGVVGITNHGMLMDGGSVFVPEFAHTEPGGKWTIEGHGVDPDIVVDEDVHDVLQGHDPQLQKAVEVLLDTIAKEPMPLPTRPPPPIKTGR